MNEEKKRAKVTLSFRKARYGCFLSLKRSFSAVMLSGAANGTRTRDPQLGKLMLYQLSYCRISKTETKVIYIFQPTKYKQTIFTITIKISALLFISTALCISCVWINRSLSPIKGL